MRMFNSLKNLTASTDSIFERTGVFAVPARVVAASRFHVFCESPRNRERHSYAQPRTIKTVANSKVSEQIVSQNALFPFLWRTKCITR